MLTDAPPFDFGHAADHTHAVPLDGAFDFINTLHYDDGYAVDDMTDDSAVATWLATHGMLHERTCDPVEQCPDGLDRAREVRTALRALVEATAAGTTPDPAAVETLNAVLSSRIVPILEVGPNGIRMGHRHLGDAVDSALALLVEPIVKELASGRPGRFRVCANDQCRWTFFDSSPTGRRRWCDMKSCGNRAKAARHRARARAIQLALGSAAMAAPRTGAAPQIDLGESLPA
jgi:predicted RNA-binding Zn ribbon-like protein